jgi:matrixin
VARNRAVATVLLFMSCTLASMSLRNATGHTAGTFYTDGKWPSNNLTVEWRFVSDFPSGTKRDRAQDGKQRWNAQSQPMSFNFESGQSDYAPFPASSCPSQEQKDALHYGPIDGANGVLAERFYCKSGANWYTFQIKYDNAESWYSGSGTPGSSEYDFWSVSSHEFGHATGWRGHFDAGSTECGSPHHTMCPTISQGSTSDRFLEVHDQHTFDNAY